MNPKELICDGGEIKNCLDVQQCVTYAGPNDT